VYRLTVAESGRAVMYDALQGMRYIHQSVIEYHGHFSSNNVIVDGRWTCKVTDYGLRYVRRFANTEMISTFTPGR